MKTGMSKAKTNKSKRGQEAYGMETKSLIGRARR